MSTETLEKDSDSSKVRDREAQGRASEGDQKDEAAESWRTRPGEHRWGCSAARAQGCTLGLGLGPYTSSCCSKHHRAKTGSALAWRIWK